MRSSVRLAAARSSRCRRSFSAAGLRSGDGARARLGAQPVSVAARARRMMSWLVTTSPSRSPRPSIARSSSSSSNGHDVAGVLHDDVVVVVARRVDRLVARDALAGVEAAHEAELVQRLQRAVDRRRRARAAGLAQAVGDLLRGEQAALAAEQLDDRAAARARAQAGAAQDLVGMLEPARARRCGACGHRRMRRERRSRRVASPAHASARRQHDGGRHAARRTAGGWPRSTGCAASPRCRSSSSTGGCTRCPSRTRRSARRVGDYAAHELRLGLVLFFVLSGFLLSRPWFAAALDERRPPDLRRYLRARVARIAPAYYVALARLDRPAVGPGRNARPAPAARRASCRCSSSSRRTRRRRAS